MSDQELPEAGLYRTLFPHPTHAKQVGARQLVYFAPVSDQGPPAILASTGRNGRVWQFGQNGIRTDDLDWLNRMVPLPTQGYYQLTRSLVFTVGQELPASLLVFLSYDHNANAVVYPGVSMPNQAIVFSTDPIAISDLQLEALQPVAFGLAQQRTEDAPAS